MAHSEQREPPRDYHLSLIQIECVTCDTLDETDTLELDKGENQMKKVFVSIMVIHLKLI